MITAQNTSHAVMAQRSEPHNSLDDFPTPPWATRAFCDWLKPAPDASVWEPAANRGYMVRPLGEYFGTVFASDVHDYGAGYPVFDFLMPGKPRHQTDWIITNPPFNLACDFVEHSLDIATHGVAVIVRSVWGESAKRYDRLFSRRPPAWVLQHVHRVPMVRGRYDPKASTATGYSWFVWDCSYWGRETRFGWLPQGKKDLYKPEDDDWMMQMKLKIARQIARSNGG